MKDKVKKKISFTAKFSGDFGNHQDLKLNSSNPYLLKLGSSGEITLIVSLFNKCISHF